MSYTKSKSRLDNKKKINDKRKVVDIQNKQNGKDDSLQLNYENELRNVLKEIKLNIKHRYRELGLNILSGFSFAVQLFVVISN